MREASLFRKRGMRSPLKPGDLNLEISIALLY